MALITNKNDGSKVEMLPARGADQPIYMPLTINAFTVDHAMR